MAALQIGDTAPDFQTHDTDGTVHHLSEMVEKGPVILAFFPKAFTPG
jgi:peroxiredoxin